MSAPKRKKRHHEEEHENHERWLVSGYDMMTLLFAVFVVLFAISSTNISKVKELQQSLQEAFSGPVLTGGRAMLETGSTSEAAKPTPTKPVAALTPVQAVAAAMSPQTARAVEDATRGAVAEEEAFQALKRRIDAAVKEAGLADKVSTTVSRRGLKIRLLTDRLFFDSGSAIVNAGALPLLGRIGGVIAEEGKHPVAVEGHTDDRPIATSQYPSNWQLSGARAAAVVQRLAGSGVSGKRTSLAGYGSQQPVAGNATPSGRAHNRRVEIVLTRLHDATTSHGGDTP
ncbi:MAG: chemotaxis protein MotB [Actinomycetota bacterium]